ncbi:hypothetical protein QUF49_13280 [Fictibacillus sp. b24]|uniref:hypothetical protein n=1 Tax=Fictibacillus sp. b24 TaxID=3055863 RepID=UPI0025A18D74|nr:hypothetical protein [Fictibacillus sp. b24]MDM5316973.1 hypothetical protein [Fictibacillus sp. b24]
MKKDNKKTVTPIKQDAAAGDESNVLPMKTEVQVEGAENQQEPAKIIFITSGFGKIHVPHTSNTSPMAVAA